MRTHTFSGAGPAFAGLLVCLFMAQAVAPAAAQTYLDEYRAYNAALETGDTAAAAQHGYAAWQAAERELGDDSLTAILAFNYGQLVLYSDTGRAAEALRRASDLQEAGVADLPQTELQLYLAYAEFSLDQEKNRNRDALRDALAATEAAGFPPSRDLALMWLRLASADLADKKFDDARAASEKAEQAILAAMPNNQEDQAFAILVSAISRILSPSRKATDILDANRLLIRASSLFPKQQDIETFDPLLAQIITWNFAAGSLLETKENLESHERGNYYASRIRFGERVEDDDPRAFLGFDEQFLVNRTIDMRTCGIEWDKRDPPSYPAGALNRGYIGAAMLGYHFDEDGNVRDPKIVAEVPTATFGANVLRAASKWRLKQPPKDHPDCRECFLVFVSFVLKS